MDLLFPDKLTIEVVVLSISLDVVGLSNGELVGFHRDPPLAVIKDYLDNKEVLISLSDALGL